MARLRRALSPRPRLYLCCFIAGLMAGVGANVLKILIRYVSKLLVAGMDIDGANWRLLVLPVAGVLLTVAFARLVARRKLEHGTEQLEAQLRAGKPEMPRALTVEPIIANTFTLGFGGSAGSEGPIAYASAAMASRLGMFLGLDKESLTVLVACGAGAGIAGIFTAPIGGVMFTLEVLSLPLTTMAVMGLIISCLTAGLTAFVLAGCRFDAPFTAVNQFEIPVLPFILLLGLFCGLYSLYYSHTGAATARLLGRIRSPWLRAAVSGGAMGLLLFVFPCFYGEGYNTVVRIINDEHIGLGDYSALGTGTQLETGVMLAIGAGVLLFKGIVCRDTNSGGGVAGEYAPALFAGCFAGWFFAAATNYFFGTTLPVGNFAVVGMAAVMAGAIKAPVMAMFITVEMIDGYDFLLPVAVASVVSYGIRRGGDYLLCRREGNMRRMRKRM